MSNAPCAYAPLLDELLAAPLKTGQGGRWEADANQIFTSMVRLEALLSSYLARRTHNPNGLHDPAHPSFHVARQQNDAQRKPSIIFAYTGFTGGSALNELRRRPVEARSTPGWINREVTYPLRPSS